MSRTGRGVKSTRRPRAVPVDKALRLLAARTAWLRAQRRDTGAPLWIVPGDSGAHYADLLDCSCTYGRFLTGSIDRACSHSRAVRLWYRGLRTGGLTEDEGEPHRKLRPGDLDHFERQDLALADVADSLLVRYEIGLGTSRDVPGDVPWDDAGLRARLDRDRARARRALVDDDAQPSFVTDL